MPSLKAGSLHDPDPTTPEFPGSMAEAMEVALGQEWLQLKGTALPMQGEEDRRLLFVAIAQGVVKHLRDNADAFSVNVAVAQSGDGIRSIGSVTSGNNVAVTQAPGTGPAPNLVTSVGTGDVTIQTRGVLH